MELEEAKKVVEEETKVRLEREKAVSEGIKALLKEHNCTLNVGIQVIHAKDPMVTIAPVAL